MKLFLVECTVEEAKALRDDLFDSSPACFAQSGEESKSRSERMRDLTLLGVPEFKSNGKVYQVA